MPFSVLIKTRSASEFRALFAGKDRSLKRYIDQDKNHLLPAAADLVARLEENGQAIEGCLYMDWMRVGHKPETTPVVGKILLLHRIASDATTLSLRPIPFEVVTVGGRLSSAGGVRLLALRRWNTSYPST